MSCESCKADQEQVRMSAEAARVMADMTAKQDRTMRVVFGLWIATVAIMAASLVWTVNNVQAVANEAVLTALETVAEMEVVSETTTTITQDTGEGNGNNVYQSGEKATYNESGDSE